MKQGRLLRRWIGDRPAIRAAPAPFDTGPKSFCEPSRAATKRVLRSTSLQNAGEIGASCFVDATKKEANEVQLLGARRKVDAESSPARRVSVEPDHALHRSEDLRRVVADARLEHGGHAVERAGVAYRIAVDEDQVG